MVVGDVDASSDLNLVYTFSADAVRLNEHFSSLLVDPDEIQR